VAGIGAADSGGDQGGVFALAGGAGFKQIDAVSFVSPRAVPQMADSEDVLKRLDPPDDVEIIGIVVNEKAPSARWLPRRCARWAFRTRSARRF
jgi:hypothetical protein